MLLLNLNADQFNQIRRTQDYPPLFDLFMRKLPRFQDWMTDQNVSRDIMFEYGLARFIVSDVTLYYCRQMTDYYLWDDGVMDFNERKKRGVIQDYTVYSPYFLWLRDRVSTEEYRKVRSSFRIGHSTQGYHFFMDEIPMRNVDCGNSVNKPWLSRRLLDFVSLDDLTISEPLNNTHLYIYCSSAVNFRVVGGVPFMKFSECRISDIQGKSKGLILEKGSYQELSFRRCHMDLQLNAASIVHMEVNNCNFKVTSDFVRLDSQCKFSCSSNEKYSYQSGSEFYTEVTNLYVDANDYAGAGEYYYRKRTSLMMESLWPWKRFSHDKFRMNKKEKRIFNIKTFLKGISDVFNFLCWGFGEKPSRTLMMSFLVILLSSGVYYFNEKSSTQTLTESLYFSIVSFTTLGFGDITQKTGFLRLFSALESLSGLVLMGLFLAGYASKTKRY